MTYNVFGGTLNLAEFNSKPLCWSPNRQTYGWFHFPAASQPIGARTYARVSGESIGTDADWYGSNAVGYWCCAVWLVAMSIAVTSCRHNLQAETATFARPTMIEGVTFAGQSLSNDAYEERWAPVLKEPIEFSRRSKTDVLFSRSELPLYGIVCYPQLLISEVYHYSRKPFIMQIYLHGINWHCICIYITCTTLLFFL